MTHALFMAQESATEHLAAAEFQYSDQEDDTLSLPEPQLTPELRTDDTRLKHRRNRSSQMINGSVFIP